MLAVRPEPGKKSDKSTPAAASDASDASYPALPDGYAPLDGVLVANSGAAAAEASKPSTPQDPNNIEPSAPPPTSPIAADRPPATAPTAPPAIDPVDHELAIAAADAMAELAKQRGEQAAAAEQENANTKIAATVSAILASERQKLGVEEAAKAKANREHAEREASEAAEKRKAAEALETKRLAELTKAREKQAAAEAVAAEREKQLDRQAQQNTNTAALLAEHVRREQERADNIRRAATAEAAATAAAQQAARLQTQLAASEAARQKAEADAEAAKKAAAKQQIAPANNNGGEAGARPNVGANTKDNSPLLVSDSNTNNRGCLNTPTKQVAALGGGFTLAAVIIGLVVFFTKRSSGSYDPTPAPSSSILKFCANAPWPTGQRLGIYNDGDNTVGVTSYSFNANAPTNGVAPWGDTNRNAVPYDAKFTSEGSGSSYRDTVTPTATNPVNVPGKSWVFFNAQQTSADPVFTASGATVNTGNGDQAMANTGAPCPPPQVTNTAHTAIVKQRMKQLQTQSAPSFFSNPARWLANTVLGDAVDAALKAAGPKKKK